ncbi:hypothetical protein GCM10022200_10900 [Microbacterium awajiense]|uniref:Glycosyl transferase family 2 n=1 Tax=Microbacterium awajiense TaxID=415214 RepID=A0ABP7ADA8_9MICO
MKIVMTLMVRDEADVIGAMLQHHRAQGIDHVLITDNASVDGTPEILDEFARDGFATVWHDPVHRKQQYVTVTRMARYAATELGADWVVNADADEFWVTRTPGSTVRDALAAVSDDVSSLTVPVVNLTGAPARDGSGLDRLVYRDERSDAEINAAGIPFHPTPDAVHRAHPEVEVSQGNHVATAPGWAEAGHASDLEVLHLPWRSWRQYSHKVRVSGEAYLANPELAPSPRHHGMQDFRRWQGGRLEMTYVAKHPTAGELAEQSASGALVRDDRLAALVASGFPGRVPDDPYRADEQERLAAIGRALTGLEAEYEPIVHELRTTNAQLLGDRNRLEGEVEHLRELLAELEGYRNRRVVKAADAVGRQLRRIQGGRDRATAADS